MSASMSSSYPFLYASSPLLMNNSPKTKHRIRPTKEQLAALKAVYHNNPHPGRETREQLGRHIGMRYQSVTNWFQNQRSTAKRRARREEDEDEDEDHIEDLHDEYEGPPRAPLLSTFHIVSRPTSPTSTTTGYDTDNGSNPSHAVISQTPQIPRKRSRPTPRQLAALRALHAVTTNPTIEERMRLGKEIGMELGKVTNWFRNLRQTARKKERKAVAEAEEEDQHGLLTPEPVFYQQEVVRPAFPMHTVLPLPPVVPHVRSVTDPAAYAHISRTTHTNSHRYYPYEHQPHYHEYQSQHASHPSTRRSTPERESGDDDTSDTHAHEAVTPEPESPRDLDELEVDKPTMDDAMLLLAFRGASTKA